MKNIAFLLHLMFICFAVQANQLEAASPDSLKVPDASLIVRDTAPFVCRLQEQMPEFPGGVEGLKRYISKNIRYPKKIRKAGVEGRVVLMFVINKDGSVINEKIVKSLDKACDEEALRLVRSMPKWKPGLQEGKPVKVMYTLPVTFRLGD